jgi:hypothetical protein
LRHNNNKDKQKTQSQLKKKLDIFFCLEKKPSSTLNSNASLATTMFDSWIKEKEKLVALFVCSCQGYIQESAVMAKV